MLIELTIVKIVVNCIFLFFKISKEKEVFMNKLTKKVQFILSIIAMVLPQTDSKV